jgi:hypothetical protein
MKRRAREHAVSLDWRQAVEKFTALLLGALEQDNAANGDDASELLEATPA